jgi:hypothetical protein
LEAILIALASIPDTLAAVLDRSMVPVTSLNAQTRWAMKQINATAQRFRESNGQAFTNHQPGPDTPDISRFTFPN